MNRLSVIGLGKLGLCLAGCLASKGYQVIGVDSNRERTRLINQCISPISEPGLEELLRVSAGRLFATQDYAHAITNSEVSFIVVPTPSQADGSFSTAHVEEAARDIAGALRGQGGFHVVVVTSTVLPGSIRGRVQFVLEEGSGKRCGVDFGLCYSPLLVALGSVIRDIYRPDIVMIGESDQRSGAMVAEVYQNVCDNSPAVVRTTFENVELAKIAINSFITMKISFANTLANLCERFPTADVDVVTQILGADSRIGGKYLKGGLGFGGPCFPRDNRAFAASARQVGYEAPLASASDRVNEDHVTRVVQRVKELGPIKGKVIAILGITYKPNTNVVEESHSLKIAQALLEEGARLRVYDPAGLENAREVLGRGVKYAPSVEECLKEAELCLLATPWAEFQRLTPQDLASHMKEPVVLDCWRMLSPHPPHPRFHYLAIGRNDSPAPGQP